MGTFVKHPIPAAQVHEEFARLVEPARSWKLYLTSGRLVWSDGVEARARLHYVEPDTTLVRRILARVFGWLPIEPQL